MMLRKRLTAAPLLGALLAIPLPASANADGHAHERALEDAVIRLAADRIDATLGAVADSTVALGHAYARAAASHAGAVPADSDRWLAESNTQGHTTGFRTWPADLAEPPGFQAPYPAFYSYRGEKPSTTVLQQFDLFEELALTFRTAYESFPFSWVYVTTAQEAMMIYPYVPIDEAVKNDRPIDTPYYQAANLADRQVGWTAPYLDLVGAGMMVTASYPVYQGESLLGVTSRDITLDQLTDSVLRHLTVGGGTALIVDADGLAIDATDRTLADEIDKANVAAGSAVLYFRTEASLEALDVPNAQASTSPATNAIVEQVLREAKRGRNDVIRLEVDDQQVLASKIAHTGWLVMLTLPPAG